MKDILLGQKIDSPDYYNPDILYPIPREGVYANEGYDEWHCYELSCLMPNGQPIYFSGSFKVPFDSPFMVESKSLKLYLNGFNQHICESKVAFLKTLETDLSNLLKTPIIWSDQIQDYEPSISYQHLDEQSVPINQYHYDAHLLTAADSGPESWAVKTHTFRSLCPVTQQPDWATVYISGHSVPPDFSSLYQYLVSFRHHAGFHERCVDQIYLDLMQRLSPSDLSVRAVFERRGHFHLPYRSGKSET